MFKSKRSIFLILTLFFIVENAFSVEETSRSQLSDAIKKGDLGKVQYLIEISGVGIDEITNDQYDSPLIEVAENG